ncbi:MAG: deacylase [Alphaproteobacteria bacterium]|nr:deacylase [Alphaproteobacteria bacterium]
MKPRSRLWTEIDFDRDGKQVGALNLPHSVTRSAYGVVPIPLAVVKNGDGPTLLFMAGNHGDEYEGQVVLGELIRSLDPARIRGRVIILPAVNLPAAKAHMRVSPLDGLNLNRVFPGDPAGQPTEQLAFHISSILMPMADAFIDIHAGGSSLDYLPFVSFRLSGDADLDRRTLAAARATDAPRIVIWRNKEASGNSSDSALANRIVGLGGEWGGAGVVSPAGVELVTREVANLLGHFGLTTGEARSRHHPDAPLIEIRDSTYYVYAPHDGVFVPERDLGAEVKQGEVAGAVHTPEHPDRPPSLAHFKRDGLLVCKRAIGRVEAGDCLMHLATPYAGPALG